MLIKITEYIIKFDGSKPISFINNFKKKNKLNVYNIFLTKRIRLSYKKDLKKKQKIIFYWSILLLFNKSWFSYKMKIY